MTASKKDRKLMQLAVEEMLKSKGEHKDKFDPLVGALLIGSRAKLIEKTHRAGLRVGDHAEYTLLERLLSSEDLENSVLYVTLEPCTKREPPKNPCADRIIAARIKKVWIGMLDPNPDIQGRGVSKLQRNGVEVEFFDLDLIQKIRSANKDFAEQYERTETPIDEEEHEYEGPSEAEKAPLTSASVKDLSLEVINKYLRYRRKKFRTPAQIWEFLYVNGFLARTANKQASYIPTVAGLLLFGKNPEDFLVQSKVKAEFRSHAKSSAVDISGALLLIPDKIKSFLDAYMRTYTEIRGFKRTEVPEYPWEAIREALVNALVHRNYVGGARIQVQLLTDRLIIRSPGLPLRPLSLSKIRAYNAAPYSRNPRIAETFSHMRLMEERGWGLAKMRDQLLNHGLPPPHFNFQDGYFVVTFYSQDKAEGEIRIAAELLAQLDDSQKAMVALVQKLGRIKRADSIKNLRLSRNTATRYLSGLVELGILEKRGKGPATHYVLIGT